MTPPLRCQYSRFSSCTTQFLKPVQHSRSFSSTPCLEARRISLNRRKMLDWLSKRGANYVNPIQDTPNYMGSYNNDGELVRAVTQRRQEDAEEEAKADSEEDEVKREDEEADKRRRQPVRDLRPFPLNPYFISQPILPLEYRESIWQKVMLEGKSVRDVSVEMGVDMRRVGAVVRMMEIEKQWKREGKETAYFYQDALISMLPQFKPTKSSQAFESINDLPVHSSTTVQLFYPTSESHQFTRADAAKAFQDDLLPADERIPHPQMIEIARDRRAGLSRTELADKARVREEAVMKKREAMAERERRREEATKKVEGRRWTFRIQECNVDDVGRDGRGGKGVGWRYGVPFMDRKKGDLKIPRTAGL